MYPCMNNSYDRQMSWIIVVQYIDDLLRYGGYALHLVVQTENEYDIYSKLHQQHQDVEVPRDHIIVYQHPHGQGELVALRLEVLLVCVVVHTFPAQF